MIMSALTALVAAAQPATVPTASPTPSGTPGKYDQRGSYVGPTWRDATGRYRCSRKDGTAGYLIGPASGGIGGPLMTGGSSGMRRCR